MKKKPCVYRTSNVSWACFDPICRSKKETVLTSTAQDCCFYKLMRFQKSETAVSETPALT